MASDSKRKSVDDISLKYAEDRFGLDSNEIYICATSHHDGYTQGRADAWRWRKYPEDKPKHDTRCAVFYKSALLKDSENTQFKNNFEFYDWYDNCEECLELWDHVERFIELPGGEND